ncbi:MAG TPA: hypothetical protein VJ826_14605, partial [Candidatus Polarisedimenticolaceae bacterium]|nr:hypothetical protein [Candidatus Polarisedimenticolaceae bacterium]
MHPDGTGLAQLTSGSSTPFQQAQGADEVIDAVISGSGNRIAFLFGPSLPFAACSLYVIDRDGTNSRLLRSGVSRGTYIQIWPIGHNTTEDTRSFDISDDGSKVVYMIDGILAARQFAGINANGTANHTFTGTEKARAIAISGNGAKVVYTLGNAGLEGNLRVRSFNGDPGTIVSLGLGDQPTITDDATQVTFYRQPSATNSNPPGIWRVSATGGLGTFIAPSDPILCASPSGNRFVTRGTEIVALDGAGTNPRQLTTTTVSETGTEFTMAPDGNSVHFASLPPGPPSDYFSFDLNTRHFLPRAPLTLPTVYVRAFSGDGSLFFVSGGDPVGQNTCAHPQVFRLTPGGLYTQLTSCADPLPYPFPPGGLAVRPDGELATFWSQEPPGPGLFTVVGDATAATPITLGSYLSSNPSVAGTGSVSWIAFTKETGGVFRVQGDGTHLQTLTTDLVYASPSISADGSVIAWWPGDVYDDTTQAIRQMSTYDVNAPLVTQDGQWVFLNPGRFNVASGALEYIRGGQPDATGSRWLIVDDALMTNASKTSLSLADLNGVPSFTVGKTSPTILSWDESPFS